MGKKANWFSALKKALRSDSKDKKDQRAHKSNKKWFGKHKSSNSVSWLDDTSTRAIVSPASPPPARAPPPPAVENITFSEAESEQGKHAYSVALATAAAAEVVHLTSVASYPGKSKEEIAAIQIQTVFRGYLARRALRALRGLVRLKSMIQGQSVKRQATTTLKCMQTLAHVQSQIRARRIRISEENQALQKQLQQKCEKELEKLRDSQLGEEWVASTQSKERIEARLQQKQEAAMRRERALAYAFSHQKTWKNSSKSANPTFMDADNPQWGWSWLERWMAARPWESRSMVDNNDLGSVKSATSRAMTIGEITRAYSHRDLNHGNKPSPTAQKSSRPTSRQSPSTPSRAPSTTLVTGNIKPPTPKGSQWGGDDDSRSMFSAKSERYRRHSIGGSSFGDDESLASSPSVPSYMSATHSAKAKSRLPSPSGLSMTPERGSVGSAKKRLSFPSPAGPRRHSGPPRVDTGSIKDIEVHAKEKVSNEENR